MSRRVRWALIVVALVIGASVAVNLFLTTGVPRSTSPSDLATYTDRTFGFALTYDSRLISAPNAPRGSSSEMGGAGFEDNDPTTTPTRRASATPRRHPARHRAV